jgi:cell division protein ZapA
MPEVMLEIGGRTFDVVCEPGQENSLVRAATLLNNEASRLPEGIEKATEKRMLLLAGLLLADSTCTLEDKLASNEERLRATEERLRQVEAKAAMLAANALKMETEATHRPPDPEVERMRQENEEALDLLERVARDIDALADALEAPGG